MLEKCIFGDPAAGTVLIQPVDGHDLAGIESEVSLIAANSGKSFHLIAVKVDGRSVIAKAESVTSIRHYRRKKICRNTVNRI